MGYPATPKPFPSHPTLVSCAPYRLPAAPVTRSALGTGGVVLRILLLVAVAGTFIGTLSWLEGLISVTHTGGIYDLGFALAEPMYQFLLRNTLIKDVLCFAIGMTYATLVLYASWVSAAYEQYGLFFAGVGIMLVRVCVGALTTLPCPQGFIPSDYDIPPTTMHWPGSAMDAAVGYSPFITFYSGHTGLITLFTLFCRARIGPNAYRFGMCFLLAQGTYMFATRGHYVIDILGGYLVGRWFAARVPVINRLLYSYAVCRALLFTKPPEGWDQAQAEAAAAAAAHSPSANGNGHVHSE